MNAILGILLAAAAAAASAPATPQAPVVRVYEDARAIERVAEASRGDLPIDLLRRIVTEDIDLLRGKRADGTYQYAGYERLEAGRTSDSFSIEVPKKEDALTKVEMTGAFVYRVIIEVPGRKLVVARNKPVFVDTVEIEYMPQGGSAVKRQVVKIGAWMQPGDLKPVDVDEIGRQTTVRIWARSDKKTGYGNIDVALLQAKVIDNADSPYADAVWSAKAILRALDSSDVTSLRAMAQRMSLGLRPAAATAVVDVVAARDAQSSPAVVPADVQNELQSIEDLLTGTEAERRQGMDRLHQLLRKTRAGNAPR